MRENSFHLKGNGPDRKRGLTRRQAVRLLGSASVAVWVAARPTYGLTDASGESTPALAPGSPMSAERLALIESFKNLSEGLQKRFEPHTHKSDWAMPYRLFRP